MDWTGVVDPRSGGVHHHLPFFAAEGRELRSFCNFRVGLWSGCRLFDKFIEDNPVLSFGLLYGLDLDSGAGAGPCQYFKCLRTAKLGCLFDDTSLSRFLFVKEDESIWVASFGSFDQILMRFLKLLSFAAQEYFSFAVHETQIYQSCAFTLGCSFLVVVLGSVHALLCKIPRVEVIA